VSNINKYKGYILGGEDGRCLRLRALPPSCVNCLDILGVSNSCSPQGLARDFFFWGDSPLNVQ